MPIATQLSLALDNDIGVPFLESFREFPPRQKPGSFSTDQALQRMQETTSGAGH